MKFPNVACAAYLILAGSAVFGGTVITNNLPANTAIININALQDGAGGYNGDQSLWYQPFYTAGATQLLAYAVQPGTYSFRLINPADAAAMFPALTSDQTNQIFSAWTYNSPWISDYLVFPGAAVGNNSVSQLFDGSPDPASYDDPTAAYNGAVAAGYFNLLRLGSRTSATLTNSFTFASATNLIFVVPDYGLGDNHGGVSVLVAPAGAQTNPVVKIWTGVVDQNWFNAGNWSPAGVPASNDTVSVYTSGTVNLTSPVTIGGILNWSGGNFSGQTLTIATNGVLNLLGTASKNIQNALTNAGTVHWLNGDFGVYNVNSSYLGLVENLSNGVWDVQCDRTMYNPWGVTPGVYFHNVGVFQKSAGFGVTHINVPLNNAGTVTAQSGTVEFNGGGIIESSFSAASGAAIHFNGGNFTYSTAPTMTGSGAIQFTGGNLTLVNDLIPNLQLIGGTLALSPSFQGGTITNLNFGGTLSGDHTVSGTLTLGNGGSGTLTVSNGANFTWTGGNLGGLVLSSGATVNWSNGTLQGELDIVGGATVNWSSGAAANVLNVWTNGVLNLLSSNGKTLENAFTNSGTVHWFDGDVGVYNVNSSYFGFVENLANGVWDVQCDRTMYNPWGLTPGVYFHNVGAFQKNAGAGATHINIPFNNAGTVTAQTGTIEFNGGGTIESSFSAASGASIHFNGGNFTYSTVPTLTGPGPIQFTGGNLALVNDVIPNLQLIGGTLALSPSFQGGTITNLNFSGTLTGDHTVSGTLTLGNGDSGTVTVLNGGNFNWTGGNLGGLVLTNGATVNWSNGTLQGELDIVGGATVNWSSGAAANVMNVWTNGVLNLLSSNGKTLENAFTNSGTVHWLDGDIGVYNVNSSYIAFVENLANGVWDVQCDRTMYNPWGVTPGVYFHNVGAFQKNAGSGVTHINIPFNNAGTVTAQTGTIEFNGGGTIESSFSAASGAAIHFNGGNFSYNTVPTLTGPGAIQFTGGNLTLVNDLIPNLQLIGGTLALSPGFQGGTITNLNFGGALSGDHTVSGTLTLGSGGSGTVTVLNGGNFTWTGGNLSGLVLSNGATVNWSNGSLLGELDIVGGATVNWSSGTAVNVLNVWSNGVLNLLSSNGKTLENAFTNSGTVHWLDGDIGVYNVNSSYIAFLENLANGVWDVQCDRTMYNPWGLTPGVYFHNVGAFGKNAGSGLTHINIPFNNAGTVTAQTGTIEFNGGGTIESLFSAASGAGIHFNGGNFTYSTVPTLTGPGAIQFTAGNLTLINDVIPNLQLIGGTLTLSPTFQGGTITNLNCGSVLAGSNAVSGVLTLANGANGPLTLLNGSVFNSSGGTVGGAVDVQSGATFNWSGGTVANVLNVRPNGAVNLLSSNGKVLQNAFTNAGVVRWLDGDFAVYNVGSSYFGQVQNLASGLWDIECDRSLYNPWGAGTGVSFGNAGTVQKLGGGGTTTISLPFNNSGTLDAEAGTIYFNVNNTYAQTGATLRFGVGGPGQSGQIHVAGNMAFDGTLSAGLTRNYAPQAGDIISVVAYDSYAGAFNNLNLPALDPTLGWQISYNATAAQLTVVSNANTTAHITGLVSDGQGHGVTNITVFAYVTNSAGNFYISTTTDGTGHYSLPASNATWSVGLQNLPARGFNPVTNQTVTIAGADQTLNFVLQSYSGTLYNITTAVSPAGAGTASGGGMFTPGALVSVSAIETNALPYFFTNWTENGVVQSTSSTYSFLAGRDRQLTANFTLPQYVTTVSNNPPGGGVVLGAGTNFYGDTNVLTAQPNFGYSFSNWTENGTVLGTASTLSTVIYTNHFIVANYAEANLFHVVTTATSPGGVATVSGAGTYTNRQTVTFSAPGQVTISPWIYTFRQFTLSNVVVSTSNSFSKTFATTDQTNLQYVAVYNAMNVVPQVTNTTANYPNPVPATTNLVLTFQFDRTMDTNFTPTVAVTNGGTLQPTVPAGGTWTSSAKVNDTFVTPRITLLLGMDGTNQVLISGAHDTNGDVLALTNVLQIVVDATPPVLSGITAAPAVQTAMITWSSDEPATSQADYGTTTAYGASTSFYSQLTQSHAQTLSGLAAATTYHFRVRSRDQAGNETVSSDQTFTTPAAPDLQPQNLGASGSFVSGGNILVSWTDANIGPGATETSWYDHLVISNATTSQTLVDTAVRYDAGTGGNIAPGGSRNQQFSFHLPDGTAGTGTLQILVTANAYQNQFESDFGNNSLSLSKTSALSAYPDLRVVNLAVTNAALKSGDLLGIRWQDTNSGNQAVSGSFSDTVTVVNTDTAQTLANSGVFYDANASGPIAAGAAANRQFSFTLPNGQAGAGHLQITVTADGGNQVFEFNNTGDAEQNNTNSISATAALAAYPDLAPTNILAPASAAAGQTIQISWTDLNLGNAAATNVWSDQVFVSPTGSLADGQWIATLQITNPIPASGSLTVTQSVTVPQFAAGNQWLIVKANAGNSFFELNTANNSLVATQAVNVGATLTLSLNRSTISESSGASAIGASVSRNGDTSSALTVNLSGDAAVSLPASVVIPAGQHSASFTIGAVNQFIAGGSATETISASAAGFPTAQSSFQILYDDIAALTLTLNTNQVAEDAAPGVAYGTITRNANFAQALTVTLISDAPSTVTVPATVTIPAGQAGTNFNLTPIHDFAVSDTRAAHVLAGATGFNGATATINVLNVDTVQLSLAFADAAVAKGAPSPATVGTVTRSPVLGSDLTVSLSSDNSLVNVPSSVTIPGGQVSAAFNINVGDDNLATGPQTANITAQVLTPSRIINPVGQASAPLTILDTHGPTLGLSFSNNVIAKGSNTIATITRNTPTTNALTVALSASPSDAVTLPPTVTIPLGQASATFTISAVLDNTQTGPRKVAVTASTTGFNSAAAGLTVSDIYFPDLVPSSISIPANGLTDHQITVNWVVANKGLADTTNQWFDFVYLATDNLGQNETLAGYAHNPVGLPVGASYTNQAILTLPDAPGNYWIVVAADGQSVVTELNKQNNTLVSSASVSANAAYRATLTSATPSVAASGTPIVLAGHTFNPQDNSPVTNSAATVRILVNGTRRVFSVLSDSNGNFSYTFQPLANEAGDYTAGADYPLIDTDSNQVSFALLGMSAVPAGLTAQLLPNVPVTNQLVLSNLTDHALTGLQVSAPGFSGNLISQFTLTNTTLPGNGTLSVGYTLQSPLTRVAQMKFSATVSSAEGAQLAIPANVTVVPLVAQMEANPAYLAQGMLVGAQTLVSFDIINTGGAESGDLTVQLPTTLSWIQLSSPGVIPSIPPGGKATVTLTLNPPSDLALTLYQGSVAVANNSVGVNVPFQFRAVSDNKGDLRVTATDDYTYYVAGAPKVTNATVTVRDPFTTEVIAQTNTDENGIAYFSGLPDGPYAVDASAPQHNPFRGSATVVTGGTNDLEAFMARQLVTYQWSVVPTQVQDEYKIQLESVFETEVPVPNVVIENPQVMMFVFPGEASQFDLKLRNEGLIAAQGVTIKVPDDPTYIITPLEQTVGTIPAQSEITVPCIIEYRAAPATNTPAYRALVSQGGTTPRPMGYDVCGNAGDCLKKLGLDVLYYYPCGGNNVQQDRSAQVTPLCPDPSTADKLKQCLKDMKTLWGSENFAQVGCSAIQAFLSCAAQANGWNFNPCALAAIGCGCGALTGGGAVGCAAGAANSGLPNCLCSILDKISLPAFPSSGGGGGGGGGDLLLPILPTGSYYASGGAYTIQYQITDCAGNPLISQNSGPHTVTQILHSGVPPASLKTPLQTPSGGAVCAKVRLRIDQDVVLTRTAFRGTLELDNGGDHAINNISVNLDFRDATNGVAGNKFLTEGPVLTTLNAVDGSGTLNGGSSGSAVYTFIPTIDAAPDAPATFQIGGTLSYLDNGQQVTVSLLSAPITVYPEARLDLTYFQQRDVYGDDPFTPEVEPSEPFTLGLIVKNIGAGNAHNFKITSGQPQIVENEKGLLIDFTIIGTEIGDQPISPSLTALLGDIAPGGAKEATWDLISTLQGRFMSFNATFTHVNDLGATNTSLIDKVEIHELTHKVLANRSLQYDGTGVDDDVPDFLVNDVPDPNNLPDTLYLSDGSTAAVTVTTNATVDGPVAAGHLQVQLNFAVSNGWNYVQIPDPGPGFLLARVVRSDGKTIALTNDAWTTDRTFPASTTGAIREHLLHLFDWGGTGSYTLYYRSTNTAPPAIVQVGPVTPFVQPGAVSSVNVTFSEPVDLSTFDASSLALTRNGGANLIGSSSSITIALVSGSTYAINGLSTLTSPDGNYQLTVNGANIADLWGNSAGNVSASVQWTKGNAPVVVQALDVISPNPRNTPVTSLNVTFSRALDAASFDYHALTLTVGGGANLITSAVTVTSTSANSFVIGNLGALTGQGGNYVLTVNAAAVKDSGEVAGAGTQSTAWTMLTTGPRIAALEQLKTNPRNIVVESLNVTFAQPIDPVTFNWQDVTLTRDGGPNLITSDVTVTQVDPTTYKIANFNWVVGQPGTYNFSVNAGGIYDLAGNSGAGSTNETWQMVLETPPSPTNLVMTPDLGISATDGLTSTNTVTLSGTVAAQNLNVYIIDQTSGADFGSASVNGTNFSQTLTFLGDGQHHLKITAADTAGNVSAPTYFDLFLDLTAPTAGIQSVSPNPITYPVTNLLVTFSKAIDTNTISVTAFRLTRDGAPQSGSGAPAIVITGTNTVMVTNLAALTAVPGNYQLTLDLSTVRDLAGNAGKNFVSTSWQAIAPNQPPVITQEPNAFTQPGVVFQRLIAATDPEGNAIQFSLGSSAPNGAQITTNGWFSWTPACDQGGTTNPITIWATDNGVPPASNSMTFSITVADCVQIQIGSAVAQVGTTSSVPVTVFSSAGITNLVFNLAYPMNRFTNWTIAASNSAIAFAGAQTLNASNAAFNVAAGSGQSLQGSALLGSISFTPLPGISAFVPLTVQNASATKSGNNPVTALSTGGRVVVIGREPLLEAAGNGASRQWILYGNPGASYQIGLSTNITGTNWWPILRVPMTNTAQTFSPDTSRPRGFYRAWQFFAEPPVLDINQPSGTNTPLVLYGLSGTNYVVESATNLPPVSWSTVTNVSLTNSFRFINAGGVTNRAMFFRAKHP